MVSRSELLYTFPFQPCILETFLLTALIIWSLGKVDIIWHLLSYPRVKGMMFLSIVFILPLRIASNLISSCCIVVVRVLLILVSLRAHLVLQLSITS